MANDISPEMVKPDPRDQVPSVSFLAVCTENDMDQPDWAEIRKRIMDNVRLCIEDAAEETIWNAARENGYARIVVKLVVGRKDGSIVFVHGKPQED